MYVSDSRLPHLLRPSRYWSERHHRRECAGLLRRTWHLVGTTAELARPGDFLTADLAGRPVLVRNFGGELRAVSNVCRHRHCLLTGRSRGRSDRLRCQYHGWEYDRDGRTGRVPDPKDFAPFDRDADRLPVYRVETCGRLVFASPSGNGPTLREQLGDLYPVCAERFGDGWRESLRWDRPYPANWKVPVENSLEAYHVSDVHPNTFRRGPGEARSRHVIGPGATSFETDLPFDDRSRLAGWYQSCEDAVVRLLGGVPTRSYRQHHVFPNLLFSFTDEISLCHCVIPDGAAASRGVARLFHRDGLGGVGPRRLAAAAWGRVASALTRRILAEDLAIFADIQRGLRASGARGALGRCEERIHAFQRYVLDSARDRGADGRGPTAEAPGGD